MASEAQLSASITLQRKAAAGAFSLDVTLNLAPGMNLLLGPSGSGKSTTLLAIAGLLTPDAGRIWLDRRCLFDSRTGVNLPPNERRVALVFQSLALFPHIDGLRNVSYGVPRRLPRRERRERAFSWLERLRVSHLARRYADSLSGGEAQRVALARALASEPRALLLDEPFSALDRGLASELGHELREHVLALQLPAVLVSHDQALATELGHMVFTLAAGRVQPSAAPGLMSK